MRKSLLLLGLLTAIFAAEAKDSLKVRCLSAGDRRPVAYAKLAVEYPDTIINYQTNRKGKLRLEPSSYPLTVTARAAGMHDSTIGIMSRPSETVTIELEADPAAASRHPQLRVYRLGDRPRRLSSTYVERRR